MIRLTLLLFIVIASLSAQSVRAQSSLDYLENALSGVITVAVYKSEPFSKQLGARGADNTADEAYRKALDLSGSRSSGSGFVIEQAGKKYVITNAHVIENASGDRGSIYVYSINRKKYEVKVLGGDTFYDIAVLQFIDQPQAEIQSLKFRPAETRIGEKVYAIGNPLGEYPYSISDGIISAKNRTRYSSFSGKSGFVQTTATVIWGNSGGPLVDEKGLVVGINSQITFADYDENFSVWASQINFALDGILSQRLVDEIIKNNGRVTRSYFGVELSQELSYKSENEPFFKELKIGGVIPGSPAFEPLKSKIGYSIMAINGEDCENAEAALHIFEKIKPGQSVTFSLVLNGKQEKVSFTSKSLQTQELISIANYTIEKNPALKLSQKNSSVAFTHSHSNIHQFGPEGKFTRPAKQPTDASFTVLSAGLVSDKGQLMYKVSDLKDIGAIIKLAGLNGVIDFYAVPDGSKSDDVRLYRHFFSGTDQTMLKTLFY